MPELPEVEYTARQMQESIVGETIQSVSLFWERTVNHPALEDFCAEIVGRRIEGVRRRAKLIVVDLSGGMLVTMHRRMTGNLLLLPAHWKVDTSLQESDPVLWKVRGPSFAPKEARPEDADLLDYAQPFYCRVCFHFESGKLLLFNDLRKFGKIQLWPREQEAALFAEFGPEPLEAIFTPDVLGRALAGRKAPIKQTLLQQEVIAGLGNIYADEALYYAHIHPRRVAGSLSPDELYRLHQGIVAVLSSGIEHGGTSFSDYRDLYGVRGKNANHLKVYQHQGESCVNCTDQIERIVVGQRSTHFCPTCQQILPDSNVLSHSQSLESNAIQ